MASSTEDRVPHLACIDTHCIHLVIPEVHDTCKHIVNTIYSKYTSTSIRCMYTYSHASHMYIHLNPNMGTCVASGVRCICKRVACRVSCWWSSEIYHDIGLEGWGRKICQGLQWWPNDSSILSTWRMLKEAPRAQFGSVSHGHGQNISTFWDVWIRNFFTVDEDADVWHRPGGMSSTWQGITGACNWLSGVHPTRHSSDSWVTRVVTQAFSFWSKSALSTFCTFCTLLPQKTTASRFLAAKNLSLLQTSSCEPMDQSSVSHQSSELQLANTRVREYPLLMARWNTTCSLQHLSQLIWYIWLVVSIHPQKSGSFRGFLKWR